MSMPLSIALKPLKNALRRLAMTGLAMTGLALVLIADMAVAFDTTARSAFVYDITHQTVLLEKDADIALPPASMSKLMTLNMLFEALRDGRVQLDTRFGVSAKAKAMGGSTMFLNETDRPTVEELIQGIIVLSGNDACVVVAEGLAGSEAAFAQNMTNRAKELGMLQSTFANASGWPAPGQRMSMRDLGILATRLIVDFPEYYHHFSQTEFPYDNRAPQNRFNRNPLLKLGIGADGLKTGHTSEAGYGLVGSAVQGDRRVVFVITGLNSEAERAQEAESVVNWAFRQFLSRDVIKSGQEVARAKVWIGQDADIGLVTDRDVTLLLPASQRAETVGEVTFTDPIPAPIAAGTQLGTLVIAREGLEDITLPLFAAKDVAKAGFFKRVALAATVLTGRIGNNTGQAPQ